LVDIFVVITKGHDENEVLIKGRHGINCPGLRKSIPLSEIKPTLSETLKMCGW